MKGRVTKWFDNKGYGFINGEDGKSYFMHISQVMSPGKIYRNMLVDFTPNENKKGLNALSIKFDEQEKHNRIIKIGDYRFVLSNIKEYGTDYDEAYFRYEREIVDNATNRFEELVGIFNGESTSIYTQLGTPGRPMLSWSPEEHRPIDTKNIPYLWIKTYQGEYYRFFDYSCLDKEKDRYEITDKSYDIRHILDELDKAKS